MDVRLTPEQETFGQVCAKLASDLADEWDQGRTPDTAQPPTPSDAQWTRMVDAGWLALRTDEEHGGMGASCVDVCVLAEQLGAHAVPAPVLGQLIVQEQLRLRVAPGEVQSALAAGEQRLAPVLTPDLRDFATEPGGVAFDTAGVSHGVAVGPSAMTVELHASKVGADLTRELARAEGASDREHALAPESAAARDAALAFAMTVVSADMLGLMGAALNGAVEHARVREQFGAPIGTFQAIQHLAAESLVSLEATRSAVWYAAWAVDELGPAEALDAARSTKAFASSAVVEVVEAAIQIFGGIGMTWESPAHVWQRRAHLDRRLFGDEHAQYRLLARG